LPNGLEFYIIVKKRTQTTVLLPKFLPIVFFQEWKTTKLELAKEHIYNHFNVFLYQCEECRDLFRRQVQLERHVALHAKRREKLDMRSGDGEREDKVGDYHLAAEASYLPWREAKPVLDTYLIRTEEGQVSYRTVSITVLSVKISSVFSRYKHSS
jgi:hypothetical protein